MVTPYALLEFYLNLALVWPHELKVATEADPFLECMFWFGFIKNRTKQKISPCSLRLLCNVNQNAVSVDKQDSYYNCNFLVSNSG